MMRYATIFLSMLLLVIGGACKKSSEAPESGEATSGSEVAARIDDPRIVLPPSAIALLRADLRALRASPHADRLLGMLRPWMTPGESSSQDLAEELLERTSLVYVAAYADPSGAENVVGVARGSYAPGFVEKVLREEAGRRGKELRVEEVEGHQVFRAERGSAVEVQDDTWLFGSDRALDTALSLLRSPRREPLLARPELQAMADRVRLETAVVAGVSEVRPELRDEIIRQTPVRTEAVEALEMLGAHLELAQGIRFEALGACRDEESAGRLRDDVARLVRNAGSNPFVALAGFDVLFRSTQVRTEGRAAVLETSLTDAQAQSLLERLDAILATFSSAMKSNVRAPSPR